MEHLQLLNMAHFAELDINNKVLRVVVACNQDITNNGGEQSEQAAEHFKTVSPLSENGVKWIQTSYNNNFRKQFASIDFTYDTVKDIFICPRPFTSWTLDSNNDWQSPVEFPSVVTYGDNMRYSLDWDENNQRWLAKDFENNEFVWIPSSSSWLATGN
jgi:hypothetical protein